MRKQLLSLAALLTSVTAFAQTGASAEYDLGFTSATIAPAPATSATACRATLNVHNYGTADVTGFEVTLSADGVTPQAFHVALPLAAGADTTAVVLFDPGVSTTAETAWTCRLTDLDDGQDGNADNNVVSPEYTFLHRVLLEEFTTENCSACPDAAAIIHQLNELPQYKETLITLCHHIGYGTDWLTLSSDEELDFLYNENNMLYAPAMCIDRQPLFKGTYSGYTTCVSSVKSLDVMKTWINYVQRADATALMDLKVELNEDGTEVTVTAGGVCNDSYEEGKPRCQVYLVENNIAAHNQQGTSQPFVHQHVARASVGTWGDTFRWRKKRFTTTNTFKIDSSWNKDNMEVIAFLCNYDGSNPANCAIDNTVRVPLIAAPSYITTAIHNVTSAADTREVARYDAMGNRVDGNARGLVIVKYADGSAKKLYVK